jgi:hypothetical protein
MTVPSHHHPSLLPVLAHIEQTLLPALLRQPEVWQSVYVDYERPYVERLWTAVTVEGQTYRVFLHRIHPASLDDALFHPHPWPSAIKILSGTYAMRCGHGPGLEPPPVSTTLELVAGTRYEMVHPDGWHAVSPQGEPSISLMVIGKPWDRPSHKPAYALQPLTPEKVSALMEFFQQAYPLEGKVAA